MQNFYASSIHHLNKLGAAEVGADKRMEFANAIHAMDSAEKKTSSSSEKKEG